MSLTSIMNIGVSGLMTAQDQLRITSDNISNVNTPGYIRKVAHQTAVNIGGKGMGVTTGQVTLAEQLLDDCPGSLRRWEWYYLKRLCICGRPTLEASRVVMSVACSPDGQLLATGLRAGAASQDTGEGGAILLWDARTGALAGWPMAFGACCIRSVRMR